MHPSVEQTELHTGHDNPKLLVSTGEDGQVLPSPSYIIHSVQMDESIKML